MNLAPVTKQIITDALGFELKVTISAGDFETLGEHLTFENVDTGQVDPGSPHTINIRSGLDPATVCLLAAHEAYHLFKSIRHLITCDEETETETFGELVKTIYQVVLAS